MLIKLGGWNDLADFVVVKMDDFDVVLRKEFLLEHQMILMPLVKCSDYLICPTVVQTEIR